MFNKFLDFVELFLALCEPVARLFRMGTAWVSHGIRSLPPPFLGFDPNSVRGIGNYAPCNFDRGTVKGRMRLGVIRELCDWEPLDPIVLIVVAIDA